MTIPAVHFECLKVGLNQKKDGYVLTLIVQPQDVPDSLQRSPIGQRYMVALVAVSDDETPKDEGAEHGQKLIQSAGILCRDRAFWRFLEEKYASWSDPVASEDQAAEVLKSVIAVDSRVDLRHNAEARRRFESLRSQFKYWKQSSVQDQGGNHPTRGD